MSSSIEERVAEALRSGQWKEKTAPNGKTFYANVKTKKTVWNLAKELESQEPLAASPVAMATGPSLKDLREERLEKARRRLEEESQLNAALAALERQKVKLENEIAILQGPVEAETAAIEELKKQLMDQKLGVDSVVRETLVRRKERQDELNALQAKVSKMEASKENEAAHREAMKARHGNLLSKAHELRADLLREQTTAEALKQSTRASELKLGQAQDELQRIQRQVEAKRELLAELEGDVVTASKQKAEVEQQVMDLQKTVNDLKMRLEKKREQSYASRELEKKRSGAADDFQVLASLMQKVNQRRQTLKQLEQTTQLQEEVSKYHSSTTKLKYILQDAKRDREQLKRLNRMLEHQIASGTQTLAEYKAQAIELKHEISSQQQFDETPHGIYAASGPVVLKSPFGLNVRSPN
jgi:tetrahydromethanopterin S-methyltransferase subunit B